MSHERSPIMFIYHLLIRMHLKVEARFYQHPQIHIEY